MVPLPVLESLNEPPLSPMLPDSVTWPVVLTVMVRFAVMVTCPVNVTYLTGFTAEASYFIATPKASVLVSDQRFETQIKEECPEAGK